MENSYVISIESLDRIPDEWIDECENGTVFHYADFLEVFSVKNALCVYCSTERVATLPLYSEARKSDFMQNTIFIPYGGIIYKHDNVPYRKKLLRKRMINEAIISYLQNEYISFQFTSDGNQDIVPFLKKGCIPEVRYTYVLDTTETIPGIRNNVSGRRIRDLTKAGNRNIYIDTDNALEKYDFGQSASHVKNSNSKEMIVAIFNAMLQSNHGRAFMALDEKDDVLGGLFLVWDKRKAYTIFSYYKTEEKSNGISTALYFEAIKFVKEELHLSQLDFEGSVLPGVEEFYQSFGGKQEMYFKIHWYSDNSILDYRDIYRYE